MHIAVVQAPVSLLLDPDLTASAKVLWLTDAASSRLTLATIRRSHKFPGRIPVRAGSGLLKLQPKDLAVSQGRQVRSRA